MGSIVRGIYSNIRVFSDIAKDSIVRNCKIRNLRKHQNDGKYWHLSLRLYWRMLE